MRGLGENLYLGYTLETLRPVFLVGGSGDDGGRRSPKTKGRTEPTLKDRQQAGKLNFLINRTAYLEVCLACDWWI